MLHAATGCNSAYSNILRLTVVHVLAVADGVMSCNCVWARPVSCDIVIVVVLESQINDRRSVLFILLCKNLNYN